MSSTAIARGGDSAVPSAAPDSPASSGVRLPELADTSATLADPTPTEAVALQAADGTKAKLAIKGGGRLLFVDLLRLLASFQMLHGHTLDALIAQELRQGPIYEAWTWQRGLVSVGFLFAAGIAFTLSTLANMEKWKANTRRVTKRWRRIGWLILLGYSMHFPAEAWSSDPARAEASIHAFMMADVLQCIGVSIAIITGLVFVLKNERQVAFAAAALSVLFIGLAPLADAVAYDGWWRPVANYLTHKGGSLFPLFPWSGYVMAGVALTFVVAPQGARTDPRVPIPRLAALSAALFAGHFLIAASPLQYTTEATTRHSVPSFVLLKLASVVLVVVVLAILALRVKRLPRWLQTLAGESLMLYWFHLMVIYGAGVGLAATVGRTLPLDQALLAAGGMVVVSALVGLGWNRFKKWRDRQMKAFRERRAPAAA